MGIELPMHTDSYYEDSFLKLQEKEKQLFILQENLKLDTKYNEELKDELEEQLEQLREK